MEGILIKYLSVVSSFRANVQPFYQRAAIAVSLLTMSAFLKTEKKTNGKNKTNISITRLK